MADSPDSCLTVARSDDVHVIGFNSAKIVEESAIEAIGRELLALVESEDGVRLVLDFSSVDHLSSGALGMLATVYNECRRKEGRLRICNIREQIEAVFKITRLDRFFEVYDSTEAAVASFG